MGQTGKGRGFGSLLTVLSNLNYLYEVLRHHYTENEQWTTLPKEETKKLLLHDTVTKVWCESNLIFLDLNDELQWKLTDRMWLTITVYFDDGVCWLSCRLLIAVCVKNHFRR